MGSLSNKCVLFAGAGASMDAKLPSWNELVVALVEFTMLVTIKSN